MLAITLVAAVAGAPPTASEAGSLAAQNRWDELYLRFASAPPAPYAPAERRAIAQALLAAAKAVEAEDAALALGAAEAAARFEPKVATLVLAARLARAAGTPRQAAELLDRALALDGSHAVALLARAEIAAAESDHELAARLFDRVPPAAPEAVRARAAARRSREALAEQRAAKQEVKRIERDLSRPRPPPAVEASGGTAVSPAGESRSLGLAGVRVRESPYFQFVYSGEGKDFARRADYEGHVLDALEEARNFVLKEWGRARQSPVDVVLYTQEEYQLHFGGSTLGRAAGFYSGKIRVANAAEMTPEIRATIVHEYVHALVDERVRGLRVPMWLQEGTAEMLETLYRGSAGRSPTQAAATLRALAIRGQLPPLSALDRSFAELPQPWLAYQVSAAAVAALIERRGRAEFLDFLDAIGGGQAFPAAFSERYGDPGDLDAEVRERIKRR